MKAFYRLLSTTFLVCFLSLDLQSSHIRAGEVIAKRIDNLTFRYEFTFIGYRDTDTGIAFGLGVFDFGDGTIIERGFNITETQITKNIVRAEFSVFHTYQAPNSYIVSYKEPNRNAGIANMVNSNETQFYTETLIIIDPFFGVNSTPILTVPPIDEGLPGVRFVHNAGAFDIDGDSLAYYFVIPKMAKEQDVILYRQLNNPDFYTNFASGSEEGGPAILEIDAAYGDLIWDAPGDIFSLAGADCPDGVEECSEYNVAFRIEEWRQIFGVWYRLGYVTRDMQIIIYEGDNEKPELTIPDPICVTAGDQITEYITGTDPDGNDVKLEAFGGPFEISSPATYQPNPPRFEPVPAFLDFEWNTFCGHIRARPYEVQFKVTDNPVDLNNNKLGPSLVEFGTWEITVVGPKPTGLTISPFSGRSIDLSWDDYTCNNASQIQIWRRVGDFAIEADECDVGMPSGTGYSQVANVSVNSPDNENRFIDTGLAPGAKYCYRIVARFPDPGRGESYVSDEVCLTLRADAPVITNVDVNETSETGRIDVLWTPPYEISADQFPPPYSYTVYRSQGSFLEDPILLKENVSDTFLLDQGEGLNTIDNDYSYRIDLYDANGLFVDTSAVASSVKLGAKPLLSAIEINWRANVPWSNNMEEFPYHYVYRDHVTTGDEGQLVLIDSVQVSTGFSYYDDGRFNDRVLDDETLYCYYVTTLGGYDNPIITNPLVNRSQIVCAQPNDNVPPCAPVELNVSNEFDCESIVVEADCDFDDFENVITWEEDLGSTCEDDVVYYRIYFSASGLEADYLLIDSVNTPGFTHEGLSSFKGCYKITALDRSLNESPFSEPLCIDNCPSYVLPNVFTPNGDGINDTFTPLYSTNNSIPGFDNSNCPRFVLSVNFKVFDRSGKEVYDFGTEREKSVLLNWNGKTSLGRELPAGIYYYYAEVNFDVLSQAESKKSYKGWVQILK
jgi:hypothetical protein